MTTATGPSQKTSKTLRLGSKKHKSGFSMLEVIVVIAIIAILAVAAYPLFRGAQPEMKTQSAAKTLESTFQKARIMAINQQRPIRVIVNCTRPAGIESCYLDLQSAVYEEAAVTGWRRHATEHEVFDKSVNIAKVDNTAIYDGQVTIPNIFWVIFMPASQVYSDPRKFEIFLYHDGQVQAEKKGWRLSVDNISGRVANARANLTPSV
ncbi:MAG: prepilin-type N-terminal cleavage/methylation domain-containing protein [Deltaproteobacteria bacterium]|jgi:prepilin-type N-terminal cleavage/methylation domain-containing protein|nr:prepilin-type N-terminal cleavage/methylation domain-containing protein [Deltaproteobacteria bacterium]